MTGLGLPQLVTVFIAVLAIWSVYHRPRNG
jgi:hypothetical protein